MLTQLKSAAPTLLWQGNDGFILWDGQMMIATDLDLTLGERIEKPSVDLKELAENLDFMFITHEHEDHFSTATVRYLIDNGSCRFIVPESCLEKAMGIPGLSGRCRFVSPHDELMLSGMPVSCIRALHGHLKGSVYSGASMLDCGYRFTFGGLNFYQPGDTVLLEEQLEMEHVDVLFVSPTEHNTGVQNTLTLIRHIAPRYIVFQHHSTYHEARDNLFWTHGFVEEVLAALSEEERKKCIVPDQHTVYRL